MEKYGRAREATGENTIWRMRIACWIIKATDTTYCFSAATLATRLRLNVTFTRTVSVLFVSQFYSFYYSLGATTAESV